MARPSIFAATLALLFVFALFPARAAAQLPDWHAYPEISISVSGVTLGTTYAEVLKQLGQPESEVVRDIRLECMPKSVVLVYPGLELELGGPAAVSDFRVWSMEVKSDGWAVAPGIRVGESLEEVLWLLGEPGLEFAYEGKRTIAYAVAGKTGVANLTFRGREKLEKIDLIGSCRKRPDGRERRPGE